ncbi:MAG: hypothetical protein MUC85_08445 [Anaerolineales bacterium]|nr:hypothetical protein [Anaerolineales bacterium]
MEILRKNTRYMIVIIGLIVMVLLIRNFNSRMADLRLLTVEKEHVAAEVTSLAATKAYLEEQIEFAKSDAAVPPWAYGEGKMAKPGDVVIVPLPGEAESQSAEPTPTPEPEVVHNWQLWLAMFIE